MARGFTNKITLAAATATRLSDALAAAGYTGNMIGSFLQIDDLALTDLRRGDSSSTSATVGTPISGVNGGIYTRQAAHQAAPVDPSRIWLFSATGGDCTITFEPY
jgi:hypothetical protein